MLRAAILKWFCLTLTLLALMTGSADSVECFVCDKDDDANYPCKDVTKIRTDPCTNYPVCFSIGYGDEAVLKKCADELYATVNLTGTIGKCVEVDGPTIVRELGSVQQPTVGRRRRSPEQGNIQIQPRASFFNTTKYTVCLCDSDDQCNLLQGMPGENYPNIRIRRKTTTTTTTPSPEDDGDGLSVGALHSRSSFVIGAMAMTLAVISAALTRRIFQE